MCIYLITSSEIINRLKKDGWVLVHVKGSHHQFKHSEKAGKITAPHPEKDFPVGTIKNIFNLAGWSWKGKKK